MYCTFGEPTLGITGLELRQGSEGARRDEARASANVQVSPDLLGCSSLTKFSLPQTHMMTTHFRSLNFSMIPSQLMARKIYQ